MKKVRMKRSKKLGKSACKGSSNNLGKTERKKSSNDLGKFVCKELVK